MSNEINQLKISCLSKNLAQKMQTTTHYKLIDEGI